MFTIIYLSKNQRLFDSYFISKYLVSNLLFHLMIMVYVYVLQQGCML